MYYCFNTESTEFGVGDSFTTALENWEKNSSEEYTDYNPTDFIWIKGEQLCVEIKRTVIIKAE